MANTATWWQGWQRAVASRVASGLSGVARMLVPTTLALSVASGGAERGVGLQEYPAINSMSAMARFPWVRVAVNAVAGDLAGVPLVAQRRGGKKIDKVEDPAVALLEQPNPSYDGVLLRKQCLVDWLLTGNAYIWRRPDIEGGLTLWRLHPADVEVEYGPFGVVSSYRVRETLYGNVIRIPASDILHVRDVSWSDSAQKAYGESAIRCLHDDLVTEMSAKQLAAKQARRGRPEILFTMKGLGTNHLMGSPVGDDVVAAYDKVVERQQSAFFVGGDIGVEKLDFSLREMEFAQRSEQTREAILCLFEVPPARAGLVTANYGTQRQQMRTYWESLIRRGRFFEDAFSRLALPGHVIRHDFSGVESLQASRTEQLMRATAWVGIGSTPRNAAEYEGFLDPPVGDSVEDFHSPRRPAKKPEEPQGDRRALQVSSIAGYLAEAVSRWAGLGDAARGGATLDLAARWEASRLFTVLDQLGVDPMVARVIADEESELTALLVAALPEDTALEDLEGFGIERAQRIATSIDRALGLQESA
jgi:HK97 family phage portal protein